MRIIIEIDPSEIKPVVKAEVTGELVSKSPAQDVPDIDGGAPPDWLVEVLSPDLAKPEQAAPPPPDLPEAIDAGPVPEWLLNGIGLVTETGEKKGNGNG